MSTYNLGVVAPTHKGVYNSNTAYKARNIVTYNGGSYMAKQDCTGISPENTTYWGVVAEAGNGSPIVYTGTFANLQADSSADKTQVYLISKESDTTHFGHMAFWNGTAWVDGGSYPLSNVNIEDNKVSYNNLKSNLQDFFAGNFEEVDAEIIYGKYYNWNGVLANSENYAYLEMNVEPGDVVVNKMAYAGSGKAIWFLDYDGNPITTSNNNPAIAPQNAVSCVCNVYIVNLKNKNVIDQYGYIPVMIAKTYNLKSDILNYYSIKHDSILSKGVSRTWSTWKKNTISFKIPEEILSISSGDELLFKCKYFSNYPLSYAGVTNGGNTLMIQLSNDYSYVLSQKILNLDNTSAPITFEVDCNYNNIDYDKVRALFFDAQLINVTTEETIDLLECFYASYSNITKGDYSLFDVVNPNDGNLASIEKTIICAGDSLTFGYNTWATNAYPDSLKAFYPNANVENRGVSGQTSAGLLPQLCNMKDKAEQYTNIIESDYSNVAAVIINMGTNDRNFGSIETSIPQVDKSTNMSGTALNFLTVNEVVKNGIKYDGETIATAEQYWNLFSDDWYGNMALAIEYIQWKNPLTQIFLVPPTYNGLRNDFEGLQYSPEKIAKRMKELADYYAVNYIDTFNSFNINSRNEYLFRGNTEITHGNVHGTTQRNTMYGNYIAKQIYNKIILF